MFFHSISSVINKCCRWRFGNQSWIGTPFGFLNDSFIPVENGEQSKHKKKGDVSFEVEDKFKII